MTLRKVEGQNGDTKTENLPVVVHLAGNAPEAVRVDQDPVDRRADHDTIPKDTQNIVEIDQVLGNIHMLKTVRTEDHLTEELIRIDRVRKDRIQVTEVEKDQSLRSLICLELLVQAVVQLVRKTRLKGNYF